MQTHDGGSMQFCRGTMHVHICRNEVIIEQYHTYVCDLLSFVNAMNLNSTIV